MKLIKVKTHQMNTIRKHLALHFRQEARSAARSPWKSSYRTRNAGPRLSQKRGLPRSTRRESPIPSRNAITRCRSISDDTPFEGLDPSGLSICDTLKAPFYPDSR